MLDIPKIYDDPIIANKRKGNAEDPYNQIKETLTVNRNYVLLTETPNKFDRVQIKGVFHEIENGELKENQFKVDYVHGIVFFHHSMKGEQLTFTYLGEGVLLFPDSRIYVTGYKDGWTLNDKLKDFDRGLNEQKNRVDTLIKKNPQPSEVVDLRIDYNGKVFDVARDRINSEQEKIEDAYTDANGKKHNSLKERIDAEQEELEDARKDPLGNFFPSLKKRIDSVHYDFKTEYIDADEIKSRSNNSNEYIGINGSTLISKGKFKRDWLGNTTNHNIKTMIQDGYLRFRNDTIGHSIYLSDNGISTYKDGEKSSGSIYWWDTTHGARGITVNSHGGVAAITSNKSHVLVQSRYSTDIRSKESVIRISPYYNSITGNNNFHFSVRDMKKSVDTDGWMLYGSENNGFGVGLRWSKRKSIPTLSVINYEYKRGGKTTLDVGNLKVNNIEKRTSNTSVYWNNTSGGSTQAGKGNETLRASGIRTRSGDADMHLATDHGGKVRVTDYSGYNRGNGITYRKIVAQDFVTASSENYKENIEAWDINALQEIRNSVLYSYNMKNEEEKPRKKRHGFVTEKETPDVIQDEDSVSQYEMNSLNTKAIQELDKEVARLKLENKNMKREIENIKSTGQEGV